MNLQAGLVDHLTFVGDGDMNGVRLGAEAPMESRTLAAEGGAGAGIEERGLLEDLGGDRTAEGDVCPRERRLPATGLDHPPDVLVAAELVTVVEPKHVGVRWPPVGSGCGSTHGG